VLKEGLGEDFANKDRLAKLLRFASTSTDTVSVSLADYKARMKEGQEAIYYITADTLAAPGTARSSKCSRRRASKCC
jgi:molecular chaperone HtpG